MEILGISKLSVATEAISKIGASADEIASIGITNRERRRLCGTVRRVCRFTMQSCGSAAELQNGSIN